MRLFYAGAAATQTGTVAAAGGLQQIAPGLMAISNAKPPAPCTQAPPAPHPRKGECGQAPLRLCSAPSRRTPRAAAVRKAAQQGVRCGQGPWRVGLESSLPPVHLCGQGSASRPGSTTPHCRVPGRIQLPPLPCGPLRLHPVCGWQGGAQGGASTRPWPWGPRRRGRVAGRLPAGGAVIGAVSTAR